MRPTDEQLEARRIFAAGESMVIEAGAGTGKTSTLRLLAASTLKRGKYLAFNRAIVDDVASSMPPRVDCKTAHQVAFHAVGKRYAHRLRSGRMRSGEIADRLQISHHVVRYGAQSKVLQPSTLAGRVMAALTRFCQTADETPDVHHFGYIDGIDLPLPDGTRTYANNDEIRTKLKPALLAAWEDVRREDGQLPFRHDHYLKMWQLSHPHLQTDVIYFDEAQDANPVMAAVIAEQDHAQRVYVGDANQAIYEFTGAVNSIAEMRALGLGLATLTQSFRFGPAIADAANEVLVRLGSPLLLTGLDSIDSRVEKIAGGYPDALLTRTNATAIRSVLEYQDQGLRAYVVGGGGEVLSFAEAADQLIREGSTWHPELACFTSWKEVLEYVEHDAQGGELRLLVSLVEDFGYETIKAALGDMAPEDTADVVVSTAHKSKGREWGAVKLAADFADQEPSDAELRLEYVAITRARHQLDRSALEDTDTPTVTGQ